MFQVLQEIDSLMMERISKLEARMDEIEATQLKDRTNKDTSNEDARIVKIDKDFYENSDKVKRYGGGFYSNCVPKKVSKCRTMPFRGRKWKFCTYKMGQKCSQHCQGVCTNIKGKNYTSFIDT